jgi:type IV pilus assembly protein PilB
VITVSEEKSINLELMEKMGKSFCLTRRIVPFSLEDQVLELGVLNDRDEILFSAIHFQTGYGVNPIQLPAQTIDLILASHTEKPGEGSSLLSEFSEADLDFNEDSADINDIKRQIQSRPVVKLVNNVLNQALIEKATDVHLEPEENGLKVRYRKDGMLKRSLDLPYWVRAALCSRVKILSELDIAEKRLPQDGRMKWVFQNDEIDMRVSTLPTRFGEKIVIRILKATENLNKLDNLGMPEHILESMKYFFTRPQGMIFVTGPTGSGKTSTLFAGLQHIIKREINITTIEDPVEYDLEGANQVQINEKAGLTFASALRSILRQDPDVILVGEIRDSETAQIAVQASQTGHLVVSTLHTNDSISALTRLMDLGIQPFLIGSSVLCVLAQRLVRKLCPHCYRMEYTPDEYRKLIPTLPEQVPKAVGCDACMHTGYNGRMAVYEMLSISNEVRDMIIRETSESNIRSAAKFNTLLDDGLAKMKRNLTTPEEVIRVLLTEVNF